MTYTIVGNTWGNFVGEKKQRIIKLLKENMRSGDQIYIDFFQIPENQQQIEQHISLYNTKELTKRIADFLRHQGYEPEINYKYNQDTKSIEILNENKVIHTSKRTTGQEILEEFGQ